MEFKITEDGFSYPPYKESRGLENPRSVEKKIHRDNFETISNPVMAVIPSRRSCTVPPRHPSAVPRREA